jgi:hypothetical protein
MKNPIFICGHRKCGTTMLHNLFDGHDDLIVFPSDLNILYAYFPMFTENRYSSAQRLSRLENVLFRDLEHQLKDNSIEISFDLPLFRDTFFKSLHNADLTNMKTIIEKLFKAYEIVANRFDKIPVFKETSIEIYAQEILTWFPDAKFLHLVRDPRDNFAALKEGVTTYYSKLGEFANETLASMIFRTRIGLSVGVINQSNMKDGSYRITRFESLVNDTKHEIEEISKFIGVPFSGVLLKPSRLSQNVKGNNFSGEVFEHVSNKNVSRWSKRITPDEAMIIEFHLGSLMKKFGYDVHFNSTESALACSEFYKWENYKYYFNDRFDQGRSND